MAVSNLNLYDILVDLVPGVVVIALTIGILRPDSFSTAEGAGLLIFGYVIGRILHALGSTEWIYRFRIWMEGLLLSDYISEQEHGLSFRRRLSYVYDEQKPPANELEEDIVKDVVDELIEKISGSEPESFGQNINTHKEIKNKTGVETTDTVLSLRYFGENYLYGRNTLYRKYEMLSTFYRSLWLASLSGFASYFIIFVLYIYGPKLNINLISQNVGFYAGVMLVPLLLIVYISLRQRIKYRFKKTRAFLNDLYIELNEV